MRRIVGWILLTVYGAILLWAVCALIFVSKEGYGDIPLIIATLPWSAFLGWELMGFSTGSSDLGYYAVLAVSGGINIMIVLLIGGLPPFRKRHRTGTKEI